VGSEMCIRDRRWRPRPAPRHRRSGHDQKHCHNTRRSGRTRCVHLRTDDTRLPRSW